MRGADEFGYTFEVSTVRPHRVADADLVRQMQSDDDHLITAAWATWIGQDGRQLLRWIRHQCYYYQVAPDLAADILQDTFVTAVKEISGKRYVERGTPLFAYLRTIARNLIRTASRKDWRMVSLPALTEADEEHEIRLLVEEPELNQVEQRLELEPLILDLNALLESLALLDQQVLYQTEIEDRSGAEVARRLGLSPANVRVRRHRALARLRDELEDRGWPSTE